MNNWNKWLKNKILSTHVLKNLAKTKFTHFINNIIPQIFTVSIKISDASEKGRFKDKMYYYDSYKK